VDRNRDEFQVSGGEGKFWVVGEREKSVKGGEKKGGHTAANRKKQMPPILANGGAGDWQVKGGKGSPTRAGIAPDATDSLKQGKGKRSVGTEENKLHPGLARRRFSGVVLGRQGLCNIDLATQIHRRRVKERNMK